MKKLLGAVALSVGLMSAFSAHAATYDKGALNTGENLLGVFYVPSGSFTDFINFNVNPSSISGNAANLQWKVDQSNSSSPNILDITGLTLQLFNGTSTNPGTALTSSYVTGGNYFAKITGNVDGLSGGAYAAKINVSAVPEPATYAMLVAGLAGLGFAARRKNKMSI